MCKSLTVFSLRLFFHTEEFGFFYLKLWFTMQQSVCTKLLHDEIFSENL